MSTVDMKKLMIMTFIAILNFSACDMRSEHPKGSKQNPINLYFTPSVNADTLTQNSEKLAKRLHEQTGYYFRTSVPTSYIAVVEAFGSNRADVAVMNSFGYLLARKRYGVKARLVTVRNGDSYYYGQIIARSDSNINTIADLQDKKIGYTDSASLSGYVMPRKILMDAGITPSQTVFAMKHDTVVTMVYQHQVDAGATFHTPAKNGHIRDARSLLLTQFPDIKDRVKVIALTPKIPNDPVVFSSQLSREMSDKIVDALKIYIQSKEGRDVFKRMYGIEDLTDANEAVFESLRQAIHDSDSNQEHQKDI